MRLIFIQQSRWFSSNKAPCLHQTKPLVFIKQSSLSSSCKAAFLHQAKLFVFIMQSRLSSSNKAAFLHQTMPLVFTNNAALLPKQCCLFYQTKRLVFIEQNRFPSSNKAAFLHQAKPLCFLSFRASPQVFIPTTETSGKPDAGQGPRSEPENRKTGSSEQSCGAPGSIAGTALGSGDAAGAA